MQLCVSVPPLTDAASYPQKRLVAIGSRSRIRACIGILRTLMAIDNSLHSQANGKDLAPDTMPKEAVYSIHGKKSRSNGRYFWKLFEPYCIITII